MPDARKEIAELICTSEVVINPKKWLEEEVYNLATQIPNVDEFPSEAMLALAMLVSKGTSNTRSLSLALDIEETRLDQYLDALCEFNFVVLTNAGYEPTPEGVSAFDAIGALIIEREQFEMKRRLKHHETIRRYLDAEKTT